MIAGVTVFALTFGSTMTLFIDPLQLDKPVLRQLATDIKSIKIDQHTDKSDSF